MNKRFKNLEISKVVWTVDQDCFLIEHSDQAIEMLMASLPFSADEIQLRKQQLGLVRRQKQLLKLNKVHI